VEVKGGKDDDDKENMVQVVCRFRPENEEELKKGRSSICEFPRDDDTGVHLNVEGKPYQFQYDRYLLHSQTFVTSLLSRSSCH
jgi:hypothetical protein